VGKRVELKLDFLSEGSYMAEVWADSKNSDKIPSEIKKTTESVKDKDILKIILAKNGGWVGVIRKK